MTETKNPDVVVALPADLIFAARMRAVNVGIILARDVKDLLTKVRDAQPRLVVLDLDRRGLDVAAVIAAIRSACSAHVLCYVSHVREDQIAAARAAGADRVMARGAFVKQMQTILNESERE